MSQGHSSSSKLSYGDQMAWRAQKSQPGERNIFYRARQSRKMRFTSFLKIPEVIGRLQYGSLPLTDCRRSDL